MTRQQIWGAGGAYAWGAATFGLLYTSSLFNLQTGGAMRFNNYEGSVRYLMTPALQFALGETYTQVLASQGRSRVRTTCRRASVRSISCRSAPIST